VFSSSKCSLFHNSNVFGSCNIHILYTECAKIKKKNNSGAKRLKVFSAIKAHFGEHYFNVAGDAGEAVDSSHL
jgi:hypothetical protein